MMSDKQAAKVSKRPPGVCVPWQEKLAEASGCEVIALSGVSGLGVNRCYRVFMTMLKFALKGARYPGLARHRQLNRKQGLRFQPRGYGERPA